MAKGRTWYMEVTEGLSSARERGQDSGESGQRTLKEER